MFKKTSTILTLPEELEIKILLNLPVKSLARFKSVCKRWYSLVEDPFFTSRYKENDGNTRILCYRKHPTTKTLVASLHDHENPTENNNQYLELPFLNDHDGWEFNGIKSVNLINRMKKFHKDLQIFGPINGIYCVFHRIIELDSGIITLWNPTTRVYKTINPPITLPFPIHHHRYIYQHLYDDSLDLFDINQLRNLKIGFGYDESINDYKVVVIHHWDMAYRNGSTDCWRVSVYNNATNSWSTICDVNSGTENPSFPFVAFYSESSNCFVNGICHWSIYEPAGEGYSYYSLCTDVLAFELASETFRVISGPPIHEIKGNENYCGIDYSVWVLRKTIAVVAIFRTRKKPKKFEVWLMSEYGVEGSWELICSIEIKPRTDNFRVVGIPNDDQIYFVDNRELISYRFDDDKVTRHDICDGNFADNGHDSKSWLKHHGTLGVLNYVETLETVKTRLGNSSTDQSYKLSGRNSSNNDFSNGRACKRLTRSNGATSYTDTYRRPRHSRRIGADR